MPADKKFFTFARLATALILLSVGFLLLYKLFYFPLPPIGSFVKVQLRRDALGIVGGHIESDVVDGTRVSVGGVLVARTHEWFVVQDNDGWEQWIPTSSVLLIKVSSLREKPTLRAGFSLDSFSNDLHLDWQEKLNIAGDGNPKFVSASAFEPLYIRQKFLISQPRMITSSRGGAYSVEYYLRYSEKTSAKDNTMVLMGFALNGDFISIQVNPPDSSTSIRATLQEAGDWGKALQLVDERLQAVAPQELVGAVYRSAYAVKKAIEGGDVRPQIDYSLPAPSPQSLN